MDNIQKFSSFMFVSQTCIGFCEEFGDPKVFIAGYKTKIGVTGYPMAYTRLNGNLSNVFPGQLQRFSS